MAGRVDIISSVVETTGLTQDQAKSAVEATLTAITTIAARERISIHRFGSFFTQHKPARSYRNPKTGNKISVGCREVLVFRARLSCPASPEK